MDLSPPTAEPSWIFNDRLTGSSWKHVPVDLLHPWQMPTKLKQFGVAFYQTGELEELIQGALRSHIFLTDAELRLIQKDVRFKVANPKAKEGHGKNGQLVKIDFAEGLVNHYFPDLSSKEKDDMVQALMGNRWRHVTKRSVHARDILQAFQGIDKEDQSEFYEMKEMADVALDEELLTKKHEQRTGGRKSVARGKNQHETPRTLASLCPPNGTITRHPQLRRYQGFYFSAEGLDDNEGLTDVILTKQDSTWTTILHVC